MSDTGPEFPSDHVLRRPIRPRRPLRRDLQRAHAHASAELGGIDAELEALLQRRRGCLGELDQLRTALNRRWTHHHVRRHARVDEAPVPPAPPGAEPLDGTDLRAVCVTLLRRHGPQDLRALHGLLHCYGYVVGGVRPVQRLGDAMGYEARCGRTVRVARGVYAAASDDDPPRPSWSGPSPRPTSPLPWNRPVTDPRPPLVDPPVAHDPEHWSGGAWPGGDDGQPTAPPERPAAEGFLQPPERAIDDADADGGTTTAGAQAGSPTDEPPMAPRADGASGSRAAAPVPPPPPPPPSTAVGDDSSTNRPRGVGNGVGAGAAARWDRSDGGIKRRAGRSGADPGSGGDVGSDGMKAAAGPGARAGSCGAVVGPVEPVSDRVGREEDGPDGKLERPVRWRRRWWRWRGAGAGARRARPARRRRGPAGDDGAGAG